jgi:hypothetical protein
VSLGYGGGRKGRVVELCTGVSGACGFYEGRRIRCWWGSGWTAGAWLKCAFCHQWLGSMHMRGGLQCRAKRWICVAQIVCHVCDRYAGGLCFRMLSGCLLSLRNICWCCAAAVLVQEPDA